MEKKFKSTLILTTSLFIFGCASHKNFVKKYDTWVGQNISHFIEKTGYPDRTFTLPNSRKVYVYERSKMYNMPSITPMIGYGYDGYYGGFRMYQNDIFQETCKLFIETNKKGTIVKWGSRGNHCVSN